MISIVVGLLFIFFKPNFSFLDIGIAYYLTNIIGYLSIFFGIRELGREYKQVLKVQPFVIFMVLHSILFFLLNISGNSPLTMPTNSYMAIFAYTGLGLFIAGMFMVYVIIFMLLEGLQTDFHTRRLNTICSLMLLTFTLAGILSFFIPVISHFLVFVLQLLNIFFLFAFYNVFMRNKEQLAEHG